MPAGAKPGERRGGRKKGTPNKSSLQKSAAILAEYRATGKMLALDIMEEAMVEYRSRAMEAKKISKKKKLEETERQTAVELFEHFMDKALDLAKNIAPYQSPKLQSTTLQGDKPKDGEEVTSRSIVEVRFV